MTPKDTNAPSHSRELNPLDTVTKTKTNDDVVNGAPPQSFELNHVDTGVKHNSDIASSTPLTPFDGTSLVFLTTCMALKDTKNVLFLSDSGAQITTVSIELATKLGVNPMDLPKTTFNTPRMYVEMKHGERTALERVLVNNLGVIYMSPQSPDKHNSSIANNAPLQLLKLDPLYAATRPSDDVVSSAPPTPSGLDPLATINMGTINNISSQLNEASLNNNGDWKQAILNVVNKYISGSRLQLRKVNKQ